MPRSWTRTRWSRGMGYRYLKRKMLRRCVVDGLLLAALAALWVWVFASTSTRCWTPWKLCPDGSWWA